jgi:hypothetical protein
VNRAGTWGPGQVPGRAGVRTVYFLLVYAFDGVVLRVARRKWLVERVTQVVVAGDQVVEQARAAVVAALHRRIAAAGRQIGGADDRRVGVVLVVHGGGCVGY